MTEAGLFAAYRSGVGFATQCACRAWVEADSEDAVADAVLLHNLSTDHIQWRCEQDAVDALRRTARKRCPCCGVAT